MTASPRRILLIDADQFFVQVARLEDPEGVGREDLVLVGARPEERGVVAAASYGTRRYGVHSAMPMARALQLCPRAVVVPVPRRACTERSRAVRAVLERFAPVVEAASIDEAYLDLTGTEELYGGAELADVARRIQEAVRVETEIVVSIGGGTSKLVAKLASRPAKPGGVHVVAPGAERAFLERLELADLPGVGPVFAEELRSRGLVRVHDAAALEREALIRVVGSRGGWLHDRARGIDPTPVTADRETKSISREETFVRDIDEDDALARELLSLALRAGADLRAEGLRARTVTVRIRDADFRTRQASATAEQSFESDDAILGAARPLLARLRGARRVPARLLGVALTNLSTGGASQLGLFDDGSTDDERAVRLSRLADDLRERFGRRALRRGGEIGGGE